MILKKVWCQLHAIVNFSNLLLKIYKVGRSKYYSYCSNLRGNTYICLGTKPYTDALKFGPEGPQLFSMRYDLYQPMVTQTGAGGKQK